MTSTSTSEVFFKDTLPQDVIDLIPLLKDDESLASLMPEGDPKIDIKRLLAIFKTKESFVAGIQKGLESRDKKADGIFRSCKNIVLVIGFVKLDALHQAGIRSWVNVNGNKKREERQVTTIAGFSFNTLQNYIGYLDTDRWKMNFNYLVNWFKTVLKPLIKSSATSPVLSALPSSGSVSSTPVSSASALPDKEMMKKALKDIAAEEKAEKDVVAKKRLTESREKLYQEYQSYGYDKS